MTYPWPYREEQDWQKFSWQLSRLVEEGGAVSGVQAARGLGAGCSRETRRRPPGDDRRGREVKGYVMGRGRDASQFPCNTRPGKVQVGQRQRRPRSGRRPRSTTTASLVTITDSG
jgi:hypothetical protein